MAELTQAIPTRTQVTAYTSARRKPLTRYGHLRINCHNITVR